MAQFCNPTLLEPKEDFQDKFLDKNLSDIHNYLFQMKENSFKEHSVLQSS